MISEESGVDIISTPTYIEKTDTTVTFILSFLIFFFVATNLLLFPLLALLFNVFF